MQQDKPDRYVSFAGIEGDKNSRELIEMLRRHIDDPHKSNRFRELFTDKLERAGKPDENGGRCRDGGRVSAAIPNYLPVGAVLRPSGR